MDSPAAIPLIRRTLIIIPTGTTGVRTFTTILIPTHIRIITAPHTMDTGPITVTIAIITNTVRNLRHGAVVAALISTRLIVKSPK